MTLIVPVPCFYLILQNSDDLISCDMMLQYDLEGFIWLFDVFSLLETSLKHSASSVSSF